MIDVIVAPTELAVLSRRPLLFLAGPIVGAVRWQDDVIAALSAPTGLDMAIVIANPRRAVDRADDFSTADYEQQVAWESKYLSRAARQGAILFWLAKEHEHFCDRAYAQTTRFELGEWLNAAPASIVVGIEPGFSGERYIKSRCAELEVPVYTTLNETIVAAVAHFSELDY